MSIAEFEEEWRARDVIAASREQDAKRTRLVPMHRHALDEFLTGTVDVATFRARIDSLSKTDDAWGFRSVRGQMFFNQLVSTAAPSDLAAALPAALAAPVSVEDAEAKLGAFLAAVEDARERAENPRNAPAPGRVGFFVSFFWELLDREEWPVFYPSSRVLLARHGLLDTGLPQPALYIAYRSRIQELKQRLGTTTWGVEHLLWQLRDQAPKSEPLPLQVPSWASTLPGRWRPYQSPPPVSSATPEPFTWVAEDKDAQTQQHIEILDRLVAVLGRANVTAVEGYGATPRCDLVFEARDRTLVIVEAKSLPPGSDSHQLRIGVGQLTEYRAELVGHATGRPRCILAVPRTPLRADLWRRACEDVGIELLVVESATPGLDTALLR